MTKKPRSVNAPKSRASTLISSVGLLSLCASCALGLVSAQARPLDLDRLRADAKSAYADGKFKLAQRNLTKVVQIVPSSASDYLMLARSAYSNKDYARASAAYSFYFSLNRRPDQRPKDEYKRVKSLVTAQKDKRFVKDTLERVKQLETLAEQGELEGSKGAVKALNRLKREGLFHPRLRRVYRELHAATERAQSALLSRWWDASQTVDRAEVTALEERWVSWWNSGVVQADEVTAPRAQLQALLKLQEAPQEALELLKEASKTSASYEVSQRYLLLIALVRSAHAAEALELTRSLLTRASGEDLARLSLLEAQLIAQVSQEAGQAPADDSLISLIDQLYARSESELNSSGEAPK